MKCAVLKNFYMKYEETMTLFIANKYPIMHIYTS